MNMRRNWIPKRERLESVPVQTWNTGFFCRVRSYNMFGCAFTCCDIFKKMYEKSVRTVESVLSPHIWQRIFFVAF
jgi:hypothetical protein